MAATEKGRSGGSRGVPDSSAARVCPSPHPSLVRVRSTWRQLRPMSSYYREHVSFPNVTAGPYPPHLAAQLHTADPAATPSNAPDRSCSVKGCANVLASGYAHKMCEVCRGRHRVYAMTKRAKRKMEKAVLNGSASGEQTVAWMPQDDVASGQQAQQPEPGPSSSALDRPQEAPPQQPPPESVPSAYEVMYPSLPPLCSKNPCSPNTVSIPSFPCVPPVFCPYARAMCPFKNHQF